MGSSEDVERLRHHVAEAMTGMGDPYALLPLLHKLVRRSAEGSDESLFAHHQLAELLVERSPWRAALHARRVLAHRPLDDRAWALTALCHTVLANYRFAVNAYQKALQLAPDNPWYAHNLGHLLDIALGKPDEAIPLLRGAFEGTFEHPDLAASYGHALARAGKLDEARKVLREALRTQPSKELEALLLWIEGGGKEPALHGTRAAHTSPLRDVPKAKVRRSKTRIPAASNQKFLRALARGIARLPFDEGQQERARGLGVDAVGSLPPPPPSEDGASAPRDWDALAAAVAYAIVELDGVPLSETEVAATFRVTASALRGQFRALRTRLHLKPNDARYAPTTKP